MDLKLIVICPKGDSISIHNGTIESFVRKVESNLSGLIITLCFHNLELGTT